MKLLTIICSTAALAGVANAGGATRHLTFKDAIDLALSENPEIGTAKEAVLGAEAHTAGTKAKRLPSVHVDAFANLYSKPYQIPFGTEVFTLYQRETTAATLTISQPLTGLAYLSELVGAAKHEANA